MKITQINHVQLNSSDVERSRTFYENAFQGKVITPIMTKEGETVKGYMVEIAPGTVFEIQPPRFGLTGVKSAWASIVLETDDVNAACTEIIKAGGRCEILSPANEEHYISAVVTGPDAERIELVQRLPLEIL